MVNGQKKTDWQTTDNIKTLTQIRAHTDNCKEWFLGAAQESEDPTVNFSSEDIVHIAGDGAQSKVPSIGMLREDIPPVGLFDCFLCHAEKSIREGVIVTANPFTRAQCMLLCRACSAG